MEWLHRQHIQQICSGQVALLLNTAGAAYHFFHQRPDDISYAVKTSKVHAWQNLQNNGGCILIKSCMFYSHRSKSTSATKYDNMDCLLYDVRFNTTFGDDGNQE